MHVKWDVLDVKGGRRVARDSGSDQYIIAWRTGENGSAIFSLVHLEVGDIHRFDLTAEALVKFLNVGRYKPVEVL